MSSAVAIDGVIRRYAWGSATAIQQLLGLPVDGRPAAELWFGAHPDDPSTVVTDGRPLDDLIAADPARLLGRDVLARFGPRLPYLVKILAAAQCLSIQVHPTLEQARAGFAREDAAGIARNAPNRNYHDRNHKPELLCALTDFDALCGFRPVARTLDLLTELGLSELSFVADALRGPDPLRTAFTAILRHPDPAPAVAAVAAAVAAATEGSRYAARLAATDFPGDVGVVLGLLLNYVRLAPGEAIYLGAGNVHAYLRGTGVEIMANSDNVLRCGLTPKHVDVDELLRVTDFSELAEPRCPASSDGFVVPVPDFSMRPVTPGAALDLPAGAPRIVLCIAGSTRVDGVDLTAGHAAFLPADRATALAGGGVAVVAAPG